MIFLHIPKTAGTSMNSALTWQYAGRASYRIAPNDQSGLSFMALPESERARIKVLRGHMSYGLHAYLPQGVVYFTMLREPISRLFSYWHNARAEARAHPDNDHWWLVDARNLSFGEFIERGRDVEVNNGQVRRISGVPAPFGQCTDEMLALAEERLQEDLVMAGLCERFEESLALLSIRMGWRRPLLYRTGKIRQNTNACSRTVSKEVLSRLCDLDALDARLYSFAARRFASLASDGRSKLARTIASMRVANRFARPILGAVR